jgi:mRNA interferase MazF
MNQYDIWWAALPLPVGTRPVLLLSRPAAYEYLHRFIAVEITTRVRGIPQEVLVGRREGLPKRGVANLDNLRGVPRVALKSRAGCLAPGRVLELKRALGHAFAWLDLSTL